MNGYRRQPTVRQQLTEVLTESLLRGWIVRVLALPFARRQEAKVIRIAMLVVGKHQIALQVLVEPIRRGDVCAQLVLETLRERGNQRAVQRARVRVACRLTDGPAAIQAHAHRDRGTTAILLGRRSDASERIETR